MAQVIHGEAGGTKASIGGSLETAEPPPRDPRDPQQQQNRHPNHFDTVYRASLPRRPPRHHGPRHACAADDPPKSSSTLSHVRAPPAHPSTRSDISDTKSEGNYFHGRKWKEDCDCLRCAMLRRRWQDGDDSYSLWGQYPCHRLENNVMMDDDI